MLGASHQVPAERLDAHAAVGELALDGRVRPVGGVLAVAEARASGGRSSGCFAPPSRRPRRPSPGSSPSRSAPRRGGRVPARRCGAVTVRAAGERRTQPAFPTSPTCAARSARAGRSSSRLPDAHNLLLAGPPGTGKTMLARRLPGILPPLDPEEALEVTRIHSVAGLLSRGAAARPRPALPRAAPQRVDGRDSSAAAARRGRARSASRIAVCCSSTSCRSSSGRRSRRCASRSRTGWSASRGPRAAPCTRRASSCRDDEPVPVRCARRPGARVLLLDAATRLVSGEALASAARPLRPRRDGAASARHELAADRSEASAAVAERIAAARRRLAAGVPRRTPEADELLSRAVERLPLSGRGRARVAHVARSAAALAGSDAVQPEHVAEALGYRSPRELEAT